MRPSAARLLLLVLLGASFVFHSLFIAHSELDLFPDEAQYWDWSRLPDWGYYSKPPLIAWTILASRQLVGRDTPVAIRLPAVVAGTASTLLVYRFASLVGGGPAAGLVAAVAFRLMPLTASESVAFTTDSLLILFWVLSAIFLYRAVVQEKREAWIGAGLALGLGLLSKYSMLIFLTWVVGAACAARARGGLRGHGRWVAAGAGLALLAFVPPLVWNARHDWASFWHVAANAGKPGHLGASGLATAGEFLGSQLGIVTPVLCCGIVWALVRCFRERSPTDVFLLWGVLPMFAMYVPASLIGRSEANWPAAAYIAGLAAFARHARPRLVAAALIAALPFTILAYDFDLVHGLGLGLKPKQDPTTRMRGWKELGLAVGTELAKLPVAARPFVLGDSYQSTAELAFYVPGRPRAYCADIGRRRCQYDYWPGFDRFLGRDAVYATEGDIPRPHHILRRAFQSYERAPTFVYTRRDREWRTFSVFVLHGFRGIEPPGYEDY
ncbi:MAG: glycosyltransferase family 39 protein [Candidatus Wallbacteria bacterium]|nr:glycosyltransferase family 39 protein [Candidatus Wallbacteria bacterium]